MRKWFMSIIPIAILILAACGGGGGGGGNQPIAVKPATAPPVEQTRLAFPLPGFNCPDHYGEGTHCDLYSLGTFDRDNIPTYSHDALPDRARDDDGLGMPVYHDHSQLYGIGVHDWAKHRRIFVGTDRGESVAWIPAAGARGNTKLRYGRVADGVANAELRAFLVESLGAAAERWEAAPTVDIAGSLTADQRNWVVAAVELVNAALPPDARMRIGGASDRTVTVAFRPYTEFAAGTGATTWNTLHGSEIVSSRIHVDEDAFARGSHRHFTTLIVHELMHALGLDHVPPGFDTLMESSREIYRSWQEGGDGPMPMSLLYPLDREALQVLYSRLAPGDDPTSYGYWASSSLHIAGNGPHANFGVALRNGIAEPWAHGLMPVTALERNAALSGAAVWSGALVGFSGRQSVVGDALITVHMDTLTGSAAFSALETGAGTTWGDGDLGYLIAVDGNTFRETGGDAGRLTGIFTGLRHEDAAGTLERSDLTAAFGANR